MITTNDLPTVHDALLMIRESFESGERYARDSGADIRSAYLEFERARFDFAAYYAQRGRRFADYDEAVIAISSLADRLRELLDGARITEVLRSIPTSRRLRRPKALHSPEVQQLLDVGPRTISLYDFVKMFSTLLSDGVVYRDPDRDLFVEVTHREREQDLQRLRQIVPKQKVAPVNFEIVGGRLAVASAPSKVGPESAKVASLAKDDLCKRGRNLLDELSQSNCDPRLVISVQELQGELERSDNIIKLGLANMNCAALLGRFDGELPNAIAGMLQAHTAGVSMYVAQYPDWITFSENAAAIHVNESDVQLVSSTLRSLVATTTQKPEIADREVPRTLRALEDLVARPGDTSARVVLAALRSIENLIIKVFGYGADLAEKTVSKSVDGISGVAAKVVTGTLLALALSTAVSVSPLADKIEGMAWMKDAIQIVQRQLELLTK